ncbi:DUF805 domain-containing protein [Acinetobacter boissieri]|uniref:Uncharacterized membrane protein YhaH, DUF805 family n=1 Tax=Acinetobacter boissieri TaxID=1219383 RepID=A0A1G6GKR8_9GAMM|nr:DUF805 domain-containing protein [Acinetobacter boissieri]SDB81756.1 Uncharacterized membrane protein YhaH, DUF805 family [Acinetobacter boissieri]
MTQPFEQQQKPSPSIFSANGRLGRLSYAAWNFFVYFIAIVAVGAAYGVLSPIIDANSPHASLDFSNLATILGGLFIVLLFIIIMYMGFILSIKRLHDLDKIGWICLLNFVPLVSFFFTFYLLYAKGTEGSNTYGAVRTTKTWEKIIGWPMLVLPILSVIAAIGIFINLASSPKSVTEISKETTYIEQKIASKPVASAVKPS